MSARPPLRHAWVLLAASALWSGAACTLLVSTDDLAGARSAEADGAPPGPDASTEAGTGGFDAGTSSDAAPSGALDVRTFAEVGAQPAFVALDANYVYVLGAEQQVVRVRRSDGLVDRLSTPTIGSNSHPVTFVDMAVAGSWLLLAGNESGTCGVPALLWQAPTIDGGKFTESTGGGKCRRMTAVSGDALDLVGSLVGQNGAIELVLHPLSGGANRAIGVGVPDVSALASQPSEVFVASPAGRRILRAVKSQDAGADFASVDGSPRDLVVDSDFVYWIEAEGRCVGSVGRSIRSPWPSCSRSSLPASSRSRRMRRASTSRTSRPARSAWPRRPARRASSSRKDRPSRTGSRPTTAPSTGSIAPRAR